MTKIKRNQLCPCRSGKKYKHCHGAFRFSATTSSDLPSGLNAEFRQKLREIDAMDIQREKQQGLGREIVSLESGNHRVVVVGNEIYQLGNRKTFHDFLHDYLIDQLGHEWFATEQDKPVSDRHPIVRWHDRFIADTKPIYEEVGEIVAGPMTGSQRAFMNLAYNIYLIAHNASPSEAGALVTKFISLLKNNRNRSGNFIGRLFETYAAAAFLRPDSNWSMKTKVPLLENPLSL